MKKGAHKEKKTADKENFAFHSKHPTRPTKTNIFAKVPSHFTVKTSLKTINGHSEICDCENPRLIFGVSPFPTASTHPSN